MISWVCTATKSEKRRTRFADFLRVTYFRFLRLPSAGSPSVSSEKIIMEQQFYQPLSAALHPPLVQTNHSPQSHYPTYVSHGHASASNGADHTQREEEEEEEDDEEVVEELEHRDHHSPSAQSSPRASAGQSTKSAA